MPVDFRIPRNLTDGNAPTTYDELCFMTTTSSSDMLDAIRASIGVPKMYSELGWRLSEPIARHSGSSHYLATASDVDNAVQAAKAACGPARKKKRISIEVIDIVGSNLSSGTWTHQICFLRRPKRPNLNLLPVGLPHPPRPSCMSQQNLFPLPFTMTPTYH